MSRWEQVDVAKGLAIVLLAFGISNLWLTSSPHFEGLGGAYAEASWPRFIARALSSTTPPTFFLLSGVVIGKRLTDLADEDAQRAWAQHLFSRGLFLVLLELGVTQLYNASHTGTDYLLVFEVLSAFGWSFVAIAMLFRFSARVWSTVGLALWVIPEVLVVLDVAGPPPSFLLTALYSVADQPPWLVEYPVASWLPFLLLGGAAGRRWATRGPPRSAPLAALGVGALLVFLAVRSATTLGTLGQQSPHTLQQFLSPTKYPVSLQYALWGFGGAGLTLAVATALERHRLARGLRTLGRQPLAAFILIKVLVGLAQLLFDVRGRWGGIEGAALVAAVIIAMLLPLLAGYDRLKRKAAGRVIALRLL